MPSRAVCVGLWPQILAFIVSMTGTVMLLYRHPDISPHIWNCTLVLASVANAALFKVTLPTSIRSLDRLGPPIALFVSL